MVRALYPQTAEVAQSYHTTTIDMCGIGKVVINKYGDVRKPAVEPTSIPICMALLTIMPHKLVCSQVCIASDYLFVTKILC